MEQERPAWKNKVHEIIFGHHTTAGKGFDVILLIAIVASVIVLMLDSIEELDQEYGVLLQGLEWMFTAFFTVEYVLRIMTAKNPRKYVTSFFGVVDLVSILPTYLGLFMAGSHYLQIIRTFRLLRIFRILGLSSYVGQANVLGDALKASRQKIIVFFGVVLSINILIGTLMFLIEGAENGFTSIPRSIYWAIVTMSTVGYGDITPQTAIGQSIAAVAMIIAYAIIAVPTGIVTLNLKEASDKKKQEKLDEDSKKCHRCSAIIDKEAKYCSNCGKVQ
ncbi:MAG: ion transporter [Crocinitomicaceae bacterium]|nr:ion transporter [Crocinitomicaceae bacterium]|tara:strand:- start:3147 stop:3974 length:828 start_codon:yes stop_codon:yes gene_type:complete